MYSPKNPKKMCCSSSNNKCNDECPDNPDLLLLRDAAADERNAIAEYLEAALTTTLDKCFLSVAKDEMCHFVQTMQLISCLDPVQAEELREANLTMLTVMGAARKMKPGWSYYEQKCKKTCEKPIEKPCNKPCDTVCDDMISKQDLIDVQYLTRALDGELHAINKYQTYMNEALCEEVKAHFCELMNEEKEHVAEFTACLYNITHEPPEDCED